MRVNVDPQRCQGHALCAATAPDLFELDEHGYAIAADRFVPDEQAAAAETAVTTCPEQAIEITR
ncbi:ferredoxin [Nocardia nova]|uniref:Ferredoxin n=1 Tax=Nocardia nova TaxID=37330 RepID=A0A2S6ANA8_9NOCA|nr:ferredoxin [Nocardia nova]PPJ25809.1 ferredoxin [Nocardia nova]PPJ36676.1 ferredoxin [Nocardia nova]